MELVYFVYLALTVGLTAFAFDAAREADSLVSKVCAVIATLVVLLMWGIVCWYVYVLYHVQDSVRAHPSSCPNCAPAWLVLIPTALLALYYLARRFASWVRDSYGAYLDAKEDEEKRLRQEAQREIDRIFNDLRLLIGTEDCPLTAIFRICEELGLPPHACEALCLLEMRKRN